MDHILCFNQAKVIHEDIQSSGTGAFEQFLRQDLRLRVQTETWEVPFEHQETLFQCEGGPCTGTECSGRWCRSNTQKQFVWGPGHMAVGISA